MAFHSSTKAIYDWLSTGQASHFCHPIFFGPGKVLVFANICSRDLSAYESDFRGRLQQYAAAIKKKDGLAAYMAPEIEGF